MNAASFAYVSQLLATLPSLIDAGVKVGGIIKQSNDAIGRMVLDKRDPTAEEWDELNASIKALRGELHDGAAPTGLPAPAMETAQKRAPQPLPLPAGATPSRATADAPAARATAPATRPVPPGSKTFPPEGPGGGSGEQA